MGLTDHWFGVGQSHYWFGMGRTDYWVWVGQAEDFKGGLEVGIKWFKLVLGLSARIGTLPAARSGTHSTSSRCTVRGTVPCRAVGSVLASHCHMRTVDFELILCRQVGDKFLFMIELSGFPAIHQS